MTYKKRLKKSPRLRLGLGFIGLIAGLLVSGNMWRTARQSLWLTNQDFSWIDQQGEKLVLYTIIPEYAKMITWPLPGNALVETAFGYGQYQWKNVFALGEIESKGGLVLARTTQETLGLAVKGWRHRRQTNLSWFDRLKWWYYLQFKIKRRLTLDFNQSSAWQEAALADGSRVLKPVDFRLDQAVNSETFSQQVAAEALSLSLVGNVPLSRVISNHGIQVVNVAANSDREAPTTLWVKDQSQRTSASVSWLKWLLPQAEVKIGTVENQWSDLVLIVGKEYN